MKKILYGTTALIAAGMISTAVNAAEPIKLQLGGYMDWYVVAAENDDSYRKALSNTVAGAGDFNQFDVMGDGEVYFVGSTMLDNGMKVGVHMELEAGTADNINRSTDESYVTVDTAYGRIIVGATKNAASKMHVSAPDVGRLGVEETSLTDLVVAPVAVTSLDATWLNTDGDVNKISYISPTFYGLTMGATYTPGAADVVRGNANSENSILQQTTFKEGYAVNLMYAETFGGLDLTSTAAAATYNVGGPNAQGEYSLGTNLSYAGFTLGGAYRMVNDHTGNTAANGGGWNAARRLAGAVSLDGYIWNVGGSYEAGPYGVSLNYTKSEVEGLRPADPTVVASNGKDEVEMYMLSGKYNLGAGVDTFASLAHVKYTDEVTKVVGTNEDDHNEGWAFATGIALAF